MAAIAPMLETLGYDPNDNEPNYEKVSLQTLALLFELFCLIKN